jgi:hypothetical protein
MGARGSVRLCNKKRKRLAESDGLCGFSIQVSLMRCFLARGFGLFVLLAATPALACSPPTSAPTARQLQSNAQAQIRKATFIIDGHVLGWSRQGLVISVLRQFKGPSRASLVFVPDNCNTSAPPLGRKVRLLLRGDTKSGLEAFGSDSYDAADPRRLERMIDGLIGKPRLAGTYSVAEEYPPLPLAFSRDRP